MPVIKRIDRIISELQELQDDAKCIPLPRLQADIRSRLESAEDTARLIKLEINEFTR